MKLKSTLALAGVTLVCATTMAWAAKPALTGQQKKEMAAKVKENHKKALPQPRTMADANSMRLKSTTGAEGVRVATELWPTLYVQTDANGNKRIVDGEGDSVPAATTEGLPNE
ncbi:hypothetical protein LK996_07900 [Lysobacter sp. A6]|uniref:PepSY domain-containing protein n=1 Tax=Noviluteimonas lactosilytica TaxID=2888523 RepID=A0ABS8JHB5_9GAMM|nr:hypothetical protein [Lysobacter lactosilyticus]MCC8362997.1 hypothetical protein [Lysobacter lactosilyticus]